MSSTSAQIILVLWMLSYLNKCAIGQPGAYQYEIQDADNLIENLLTWDNARDNLFEDAFLSPNTHNHKESASGNHRRRSARFSELTKEIGKLSNDNIREFQRLTALGLPRILVINVLKTRRHPTCKKPIVVCTPNSKYRTIDGNCNNIIHPLWGSSYHTFQRLFPAQYADGFNKQKGLSPQRPLPNARLISATVHPDLIHPDPTLTNFVPQVGQFLDHDFALTIEEDRRCCTTEKDHKDCWPIEIPTNDYFYSNLTKPQTCMDFTRSTAYCFPTESGVREQFNIDTSYIDGSNVYGSEYERSKLLREFKGGRLQVSKENPKLIETVKQAEAKYNTKIEFMGKYLAGDDRVNEMPALTVMHTLWVREHNRLAYQISAVRPNWNDEKIFQEARRIVVAQWQNVIFGQFLPIVLGNNTMKKHNLDLGPETAYSDYNINLDATLFHYFATAAYRFGHTLLNGLIRLVRGLTEVGSYLVRDNYFEAEQIERNNSQGYELILGGLMTQNSQTYDRFVSEDFTNFLFKEKQFDFGADLVARNIQRSRDHAIPNYGVYRTACGLSALTNWTNKPPEILEETWQKLKSVYELPEDIELFPGGLCEVPMDKGAVSGATFNCLKAKQFHLLKFGDRFFFTHRHQAGSFTPQQLKSIRRRTLGDVICDNSDLEQTTINVFKVASENTNPRLSCKDPRREKIKISDFVPTS